MSDQNAHEAYQVTISGSIGSVNGLLYSYDGFDDEFMLALAGALHSLDWGSNRNFSLVKIHHGDVNYAVDYTTDPPSFV